MLDRGKNAAMPTELRFAYFFWGQTILLIFVCIAETLCWRETRNPISQAGIFIALTAGSLGLIISFACHRLALTPLRDSLTRLAAKAREVLRGPARAAESQGNLLDDLSASMRQIEHSLVESRTTEQTLLRNVVDVICIIDINLNFISVNPSVERAWGYKPEELVGKNLSAFTSEAEGELLLRLVAQSEKSIEQIIFETTLRTRDGSTLDLLWSAHWSASEGGLFCVAHDITQRKSVERKLQESERNLRAVLEKLPVGVLTYSDGGGIDFANDRARDILKEPTILDNSNNVHKYISEDVLSDALRPSVLPVGGAAAKELDMRRQDGTIFKAEVSLALLQVATVQKTVLLFVDVTEREELERLRNDVVAMVSHDLRTPLTSINLILLMADEGDLGELSETGKQLFGRCRQEIERLMQMVNDLLDAERSRSGKLIKRPVLSDVRKLVDDSCAAVLHFANAHQIELRCDITELQVVADANLIVQVMVNLLSNAIKFSTPGQSVEISAKRSAHRIRLEFSDRGRGVPAEKRALIFERFQQVESTDRTKTGGAGLGLAICKLIVEEHGGEIGIDERPGGGSIFWFTLPAQ